MSDLARYEDVRCSREGCATPPGIAVEIAGSREQPQFILACWFHASEALHCDYEVTSNSIVQGVSVPLKGKGRNGSVL